MNKNILAIVNSRTILSMFIILFVVFSFITYIKLKDFDPKHECCKDIRSQGESTLCVPCVEYKIHERIIYVWRFGAEKNDPVRR